MPQRPRLVAGVLAAVLVVGGCYGPFNLTRKLYNWNGQASQDKWGREAVFLLCVWVPVYGLATLADGLIFNSIEFWTGDNPIKMDEPSGRRRHTRRITGGDAEAILSRATGPEGERFAIEQFQHGRPAAALQIQRRDGLMVAANAEGQALFQARTLDDGSIRVENAGGEQVALYSADEVQRVLASRQ
ncbi:MAG: DUF3332 family protein [Candidatus Omnitrophica bacterium]|nr:DUF3332 family protein [Candidatus Omnitrophota bacterium]